MEFVERQGVTVVLIGNFNPAIITPDWLARQEVISADEADAASIEVIHPDLARFTIPDITFEVTAERFAIMATAEPFVRLPDVVAGIFQEHLPHTPITALGINFHAHFRVRDWKQQTALGRALAPTEPWGDFGKGMDAEDLQSVGGMASITMQQKNIQGRPGGHIQVTVQPSNKIAPGFGVFVDVNDHYEGGGQPGPFDFPSMCVEMFTPSLERSRQIMTSLSMLAKDL